MTSDEDKADHIPRELTSIIADEGINRLANRGANRWHFVSSLQNGQTGELEVAFWLEVNALFNVSG